MIDIGIFLLSRFSLVCNSIFQPLSAMGEGKGLLDWGNLTSDVVTPKIVLLLDQKGLFTKYVHVLMLMFKSFHFFTRVDHGIQMH